MKKNIVVIVVLLIVVGCLSFFIGTKTQKKCEVKEEKTPVKVEETKKESEEVYGCSGLRNATYSGRASYNSNSVSYDDIIILELKEDGTFEKSSYTVKKNTDTKMTDEAPETGGTYTLKNNLLTLNYCDGYKDCFNKETRYYQVETNCDTIYYIEQNEMDALVYMTQK